MSEADTVFIDVESSGLHRTSYPVEVGWAEPALGLPATSFLIAPAADWSADNWDPATVELNALDWEYCSSDGLSVVEVATRLNEALRSKRVFSDAVDADSFWMDRLFNAAAISRQFRILPASTAFAEVYGDTDDVDGLHVAVAGIVDAIYPLVHRAGPDATRLAAIHLAATSVAFRDQLADAIAAIAATSPVDHCFVPADIGPIPLPETDNV